MATIQSNPNAAALPDVAFLLEQMNIALGIRNAATDLANVSFSILIKKRRSEAHNSIFIVWFEGNIDSLTFCHNAVQNKKLDRLHIPQKITLVHYTNDIMLIGLDEQEVARTLQA